MMGNVSSRITLNRMAIRRIEQAQITALEKTAEFVHTDVVQSQTIPFKSGTLQNTKHFVDLSDSKNGQVSINVEGPYARRLYFHPEYNFDKGENPNAGGEWFEPYKDGGNKNQKVKNAYKRFFRQESGV